MQQKGRETPGSQPAMPSGNENTTRSFFENLMNGGGNVRMWMTIDV